MDKFTKLTGIAAPMPLVNIDTDMIIPKQFLKTIARTGLGKNLFDEMRYNTDGSVDTGFGIGGKLVVALTPGNDVAQAVVLQPDGKILVAGVADRGYGDISTTFALLRFNADGSRDTSDTIRERWLAQRGEAPAE